MKFIKLVWLHISIAIALACENIPIEVLDGCALDSLAVVNPSIGFVITGENCGLEVDKEIFAEQPYVFYSDASDYTKYSLIMVDNDNPLVADGNSYLHWMITDIDGQSLKHGLGIYSGKTVAGKESLNFKNI